MSEDSRSNEEIRAETQDLHARLRDVVRYALVAVQRLEREEEGAEIRVRAALEMLANAVTVLVQEERAWFEPALREIDAWGENRVEELRAAHAEEEAVVTMGSLDAANCEDLARHTRAVIRRLLAALRNHERNTLSPDLWSNDTVVVNQESG